MPLKIRLSLPKDLPAVFRLYQEFNHTKLSFRDFSKLVRAAKGRDFIFCAEANGKIVGYIIAKTYIDVEEPGMRAEITDFFVTPKARGIGAGRALLAKAIRFSKTKGAKRITLQTTSEQTRADTMYRKTGFKKSKVIVLHKAL